MNDDLLIKFLLGEAAPAEQEQVNLWINAHPDNQKEFERFRTIWQESKNLEVQIITDVDLAWQQFRTRIADPDPVVMMPVRKRLFSAAWRQVAAVLFIMAGAWSFYEFYLSGFSTLDAGQMVLTETLPDGSEVVLNKNTKMAYQRGFRGAERKVRLEDGEVFFKVSPDKNKPFVIEASTVTVSVLGTSFNVKHHKNETEVIVETGLVRVAVNGQSVDLHPGEKVLIKKGQGTLRKQFNTDLLHQYYRSHIFVADNTPLQRVVEVLNEAYGNRIVIENPALNDLRLTTTFKEDDLENIVHVIEETFKISAVREGDKIIFR